ncbi:unnamed protein product [Parascedosporium putredinis]|uniref:Uncharacterized protein n=1 Tax=Parascedosporium putredinis TaxID=1442378 RepID=A0A9P1MAA2_9PEZI|nr:unnamed protein product [Parascedosporium putredinis]CAI7992387.1 unnamed protein product [Parascedosporium putredinis]
MSDILLPFSKATVENARELGSLPPTVGAPAPDPRTRVRWQDRPRGPELPGVPPRHGNERGKGPVHGGYPPLAYSWSSELQPRGPRAWRWYNCVCHHVSPAAPDSVALRFDDCLFGTARNCDGWEGVMPQKCKLGVTGFLMTCQQGYEEATDVLYSTCRLFVKGQPLIDGLLQQYILPDAPRLTGPSFLRLTSLVLCWSLVLFGNAPMARQDEGSQHPRFLRNLELLPRAFPYLTRLHLAFENLSFSGGQFAPISDEPLSEVSTDFLDPIRSVGERIEGLSGLNFSAFIPHDTYTIILSGPLPDGAWSEDSFSVPGRPTCIWYPLVPGPVKLAESFELDLSFGRSA